MSENRQEAVHNAETAEGVITNIQRYCIHDGPGVRTVVFLKGCPLRCRWCCNPETMQAGPQLGFVSSLCSSCRACIGVCPHGAISITDELGLQIDRAKCDMCGKCVKACYRGALKQYGMKKTAAEVMREVSRDKSLFEKSGGGMTLSGGEALFQPQFAEALLTLARENGIRTAVETSLNVPEKTVREVLPLLDHIMFDVKCLDDAVHKEYTGVSADQIRRNIQIVGESGISAQPRMPFIPGVNDTEDNLKNTADFLLEAGFTSIELMPFHKFASGKYDGLGWKYNVDDLRVPTHDDTERARLFIQKTGLNCLISV